MDVNEMRAWARRHRVTFKPSSESKFLRCAEFFLRILRINRDLRGRYWQSLGRTVYYPSSLESFDIQSDSQVEQHKLTLLHEFTHVRQWERWWILFPLFWLLFPLPIGLAYFRWRFEREAYLVQLYAGVSPTKLADTLWEYGWPWPRTWMRRWFEAKKGLDRREILR